MHSFEFGLALMTLSDKNFDEVFRLLPRIYLIENKSEVGWGYVITLSSDDGNLGDLDQQITGFLSGLWPISKWIRDSESVLRVAVYNDKMTCTVNLNKFDMLVSSNIKLELTVYPVE